MKLDSRAKGSWFGVRPKAIWSCALKVRKGTVASGWTKSHAATLPRCQSCRYGRATEMPWKGFQPRRCLPACWPAESRHRSTAALPRAHAGRVAVLVSLASNRISSLRTEASLPTVSSVAAPVASRVSSSTSRSRRTSAIVSPICHSVSESSQLLASEEDDVAPRGALCRIFGYHQVGRPFTLR